MLFGKECFDKLIREYTFETVLDVGAGGGQHTLAFLDAGKKVTAVDIGKSIYFKGFESHPNLTFVEGLFKGMLGEFDCVWACHVLEHQPNPGNFLKDLKRSVKPGGILAITVPPAKPQIVGGHLTIWNAGLLLYNLVFAGFNCRQARIKRYGYNISVVLKYDPIPENAFSALTMDNGDIRKLREFFPAGLEEGFNGEIEELNWRVPLNGGQLGLNPRVTAR